MLFPEWQVHIPPPGGAATDHGIVCVCVHSHVFVCVYVCSFACVCLCVYVCV